MDSSSRQTPSQATQTPYQETPYQDTAQEPVAAGVSRRTLLKAGIKAGVMGAAAIPSLAVIDPLAWIPDRLALAAPTRLPEIQFDIGAFIAPARTIDGVLVRFGPVFTLFATARLTRTPTRRDQNALEQALTAIEEHYPFSPSGVFAFIAYGLPYFQRLPGGATGSLVASHLPRLLVHPDRFALEEAVPSPTDVASSNPGITKKTFNVPVAIETNDLLLTLRSDSTSHIQDIMAWLGGSDRLRGKHVSSPPFRGLFSITSQRMMFQQPGLPRRVADQHRLPYASRIQPQSPMWMGFADQQTSGSGPAAITTFQGNASMRFTSTQAGDYFASGAIQHLSHVILDLAQFYADPDEPFTERVQYMFRSNPIPSTGDADQFTNGGGPSFLNNIFQGADDALRNAEALGTFQGQPRMGHLSALQRSSRAPDGTPVHIRMDGSGFDALDVPGGAAQPKLQFTVFVPTADFFATMRRNQAALDLVQQHQVDDDDNGLERFITATRRQNFLVPPRAHRAFPLLELARAQPGAE
jgi:hypothetical protein